MTQKQKESVEKIFKILKICKVSMRQRDLIQSLERQFVQNGSLSERQLELLFDLYERA